MCSVQVTGWLAGGGYVDVQTRACHYHSARVPTGGCSFLLSLSLCLCLFRSGWIRGFVCTGSSCAILITRGCVSGAWSWRRTHHVTRALVSCTHAHLILGPPPPSIHCIRLQIAALEPSTKLFDLTSLNDDAVMQSSSYRASGDFFFSINFIFK